MTAVGSVVGIAVSIVAGRAVSAFLFGVQAADPLSLGAAVVALTAVSGMAAYAPARRAASLDPLTAWRAD